MPKPSLLFDFATGDTFDTGARVGEDVKKPVADVPNGFVPGTPITPEQLNYCLNITGEWLAYLNGLEVNESLTWELAQSFKNPLTLGAALIADPDDTLIARIHMALAKASVGTRTCILDTTFPGILLGAFSRIKVYVSNPTDNLLYLEIVQNATWNRTDELWEKLVDTEKASILSISQSEGIRAAEVNDSTDTWEHTFTTGGWEQNLFRFQGAGLDARVDCDTFQLAGALVGTGAAAFTGNLSTLGDLGVAGTSTQQGPATFEDTVETQGVLTPTGGFDSVDVARAWVTASNQGALFTALRGEHCTVSRNTGTNEITLHFDDATPGAILTYQVDIAITQTGFWKPCFVLGGTRTDSDYTFKIVDETGAVWDLDDTNAQLHIALTLRY